MGSYGETEQEDSEEKRIEEGELGEGEINSYATVVLPVDKELSDHNPIKINLDIPKIKKKQRKGFKVEEMDKEEWDVANKNVQKVLENIKTKKETILNCTNRNQANDWIEKINKEINGS